MLLDRAVGILSKGFDSIFLVSFTMSDIGLYRGFMGVYGKSSQGLSISREFGGQWKDREIGWVGGICQFGFDSCDTPLRTLVVSVF